MVPVTSNKKTHFSPAFRDSWIPMEVTSLTVLQLLNKMHTLHIFVHGMIILLFYGNHGESCECICETPSDVISILEIV